MGILIAHEMMHALEMKARSYNMHGIKNQWWTEDSINEYNKRADCIRKQFSRFKVYDSNVRLQLTIDI